MANKGDVREIVSDPGSQLKGAARELSDWRKNWDPEQLVRFGADKGLKWSFIMADSQHQNGGAESLIKVVKGIMRSMTHAIGDTKLSLNELNTLLAECANLANERPIGVKPRARLIQNTCLQTHCILAGVPPELVLGLSAVQILSVKILNMQGQDSNLCSF